MSQGLRIETTSTSKNEYDGRRIVETVTDIHTTPRPSTAEFAYSPPLSPPRNVNVREPNAIVALLR